MDEIEKAFDVLMNFEGGDKLITDSGGLTKFGISQKAYPNLDIANLTREQALAIFGTDFYLKSKASQLPEDLKYIHVDTAYNCGVETAAMILQRAAGVTDDGDIGGDTLKAAQFLTIDKYAAERVKHYYSIVAFEKNKIVTEEGQPAYDALFAKGKTLANSLLGWKNRVTKIVQMQDAGLI